MKFILVSTPIIIPTILLLLQHRMIYFPRKYDSIYLSDIKKVISLSYQTSQGKQTAFYVPPYLYESPEIIWILFSGNASLAMDWYDMVERFSARRIGFLLIDYPGYGFCSGKASPNTILETSQIAFQALCEHIGKTKMQQIKIGLMGHSLGAATCLQFATHLDNIHHIILVSPFTSMIEMAKRVVGIPLCYILRHRYDNVNQLTQLKKKHTQLHVTLFHGTIDDVISVDMGRTIHDLFPQMIQYHESVMCDHNSILSTIEPSVFNIWRMNHDKN